jgi:hypothetical protein
VGTAGRVVWAQQVVSWAGADEGQSVATAAQGLQFGGRLRRWLWAQKQAAGKQRTYFTDYWPHIHTTAEQYERVATVNQRGLTRWCAAAYCHGVCAGTALGVA